MYGYSDMVNLHDRTPDTTLHFQCRVLSNESYEMWFTQKKNTQRLIKASYGMVSEYVFISYLLLLILWVKV